MKTETRNASAKKQTSTKTKKTPIQKLFGCMKGKISYESDAIFNLN